jgi:hypothetical protein
MATNELKRAYIAKIRSDTAYPTVRNLARVIAILMNLIAALCFCGAIYGLLLLANPGKQESGLALFLAGTGTGLVYVVAARLIRELANMAADIADTVTETASRATPATTTVPLESISSPPPPHQPSDVEGEANDLLVTAREHLVAGEKALAIETLREIIKLYPASRAAEKARSSLKGR